MTKRLLVGLVAAFLSVSALAIESGKAFDDPKMQARYDRLIAEIRCVTCQNQSIKDSNALIAGDLKREIRRMMNAGQSDDEIAEFLVTRYGDFVLYRPRMSGNTLLLWIAPFAFIVFGGFAFFRVLRHRMMLPIEDDALDEGPTE